jgi:hypothetical protein
VKKMCSRIRGRSERKNAPTPMQASSKKSHHWWQVNTHEHAWAASKSASLLTLLVLEHAWAASKHEKGGLRLVRPDVLSTSSVG